MWSEANKVDLLLRHSVKTQLQSFIMTPLLRVKWLQFKGLAFQSTLNSKVERRQAQKGWTTWWERQALDSVEVMGLNLSPSLDNRLIQGWTLQGAAMSDLLWGNDRGMCTEVKVSWRLFELNFFLHSSLASSFLIWLTPMLSNWHCF